MKIAVTGATGFIGGYMVRGMAAAGHEVRAFVRPGRESALEVPPQLKDKVQLHVGDLTDGESVRGFSKDCQFLIHLASAHDHFSQEHMQAVNVTGTEHLVRDCEENAPEDFQLINVASAVIGMPVYSYYRDSKRVQEKIVRASSLRWGSFRPTLVYGEGDYRHTAPLLRKCGAEKGSYWVPHEGVSKINPVHVDDLVDVVRTFFDYERGREDFRVFEIAGPAGVHFNDFVDLTIEATGGAVKRRNIPRRWIERMIFLKGLFKDVTKERRGAGYFSLHHEHDIRPAQEELGFAPRTFAQGINEVAQGDWWRHEDPDGAAASGQAGRLGTGGV